MRASWSGLFYCAVIILHVVSQVLAGNESLTTGIYAATLGAGAATAGERDAFGQNPAAISITQAGRIRAGFHLDYHRPYGMEELQIADAGAFCDLSRMGISISWRQLEVQELYREEGLSFSPAFKLRENLLGYPIKVNFGGNWTGWQTEILGEEQVSNQSYGVGIIWFALPRFKLGAFTRGRSFPWSRAEYNEPIWQWGLEANGREPDSGQGSWPLQTLRLDFRKVGRTPWRSLAGLSLSPHPAIRISAGLASPPFQVSIGINLNWEGLQWYQSMQFHRYLGRTFYSGLAFAREFAPGNG